MTRETIVAIRQGALAQAAMCDALLASFDAAAGGATAGGRCPHPREARKPAPTMGDSRASVCTDCGAEIGGTD